MIEEEFNPEKGDEVAWKDHAVRQQLEHKVKEAIAEMLEGQAGRQLITPKDAAKYLKKHLGIEIASFIASLDEVLFTKVIRVNSKESFSPIQGRNVVAAYLIVDILLASFSEKEVKNWLVDYNEYLHGIPAVEITKRPEDVRMAALHLVMEGKTIVD